MRGERRCPEMTGYRLAGRRDLAAPAQQIAHRKRMIGVNLALARDRDRQLDERLHQFPVDLFGALRGAPAWRVEEQAPVNGTLTRDLLKSEEIGKDRHRFGLAVQKVPVADL